MGRKQITKISLSWPSRLLLPAAAAAAAAVVVSTWEILFYMEIHFDIFNHRGMAEPHPSYLLLELFQQQLHTTTKSFKLH